jgi:hypothetical protein
MRSALHLNASGALHSQLNIVPGHARDNMASRLAVSSESVEMETRSTGTREIRAGAKAHQDRTPLTEREQGLLGHHLRKRRVWHGLRRNTSEGEIGECSAHAHGNHSLVRFSKRVHPGEQIRAGGAGRNRA